MRSCFPINAGRSWTFAGGFYRMMKGLAGKQGRALAFSFVALFTLCVGSSDFTVVASADDITPVALWDGLDPLPGPGPGQGTDPHPKPIITNFAVIWDGIDTYFVSGMVTNCDDVGYLVVEFSDMGEGGSAMTNMTGDFYQMFVLPNSSGLTISASVTCREQQTSNMVYATLP